MSRLIINGKNKLYGKVEIKSAKNALLPLIASCILLDFEVAFLNVSKLTDVIVMLDIIKSLGGKYRFEGDVLYVDCSTVHTSELPSNKAEKIRASIFMLGALISRFHKALTVKPGGCNFCERPIDMHLDAFKKLGVEISDGDYIYLRTDEIKSAKIILPFSSVGVTVNVITACCVGKGETVIINAAREPEIVCLANFLNSMGAKIVGAGTSKIYIKGVKKLTKTFTHFRPITDRIEAGTFALAVMNTGGEIELIGANFIHNMELIKKIYNNACKMTFESDKIYIKSSGKGKGLGVLKTAPYPAFPTDLQSPILAYSCFLNGKSVIIEGVFKNRFSITNELTKMNADLVKSGDTVTVFGKSNIYGAVVDAKDLRTGAGLIIAGLNAEGKTIINGLEVIERGYFDIDKKLASLGAVVRKD